MSTTEAQALAMGFGICVFSRHRLEMDSLRSLRCLLEAGDVATMNVRWTPNAPQGGLGVVAV